MELGKGFLKIQANFIFWFNLTHRITFQPKNSIDNLRIIYWEGLVFNYKTKTSICWIFISIIIYSSKYVFIDLLAPSSN